jgi:hypothetical protein
MGKWGNNGTGMRMFEELVCSEMLTWWNGQMNNMSIFGRVYPFLPVICLFFWSMMGYGQLKILGFGSPK